jgi:hypothetical protein
MTRNATRAASAHVAPDFDTEAERDAYERGYAKAWVGASNMARPPVAWVPVHATWGQLKVGHVVLDQNAAQWMVKRCDRIPSGLAVTIVGASGEWSWPNQADPVGKDPGERVWIQEMVDMAEAHAVAGQQLGGYVLTRAIGALPPAAEPNPDIPGMRGTWRMTGAPI